MIDFAVETYGGLDDLVNNAGIAAANSNSRILDYRI